MKIIKMVEELKPKINQLTERVDGLVVKVDNVATRVEEVATTAKSSMDEFRGASSGLLGTIEHLSKSVVTTSDMITPILTGGFAAYKIFTTLKAAKSQKAASKPKTEIVRKSGGKKQ